MTAAHTSGHWSQERAGTPFANNRVWPEAGPTPICSLSSFGQSPADIDPTAQANGRLIAAAPEMAAALLAFVRSHNQDLDAWRLGALHDAEALAVAALGKAGVASQ